MDKFNQTFSALNLAASLNKQWEANSAVQNIFRMQDQINRQMQPYRGMLDMITSASRQINAYMKPYEGIFAIANAISKQTRFNIPTASMTAIDMITRQQRQLLVGTDAMRMAMAPALALARLGNLHGALDRVSGRITAIAAATNQWEIVDDFEQITEQAVDFSEQIAEEIALSEESQAAFDQLVDVVTVFLKRYHKAGLYSLLFIDILLRIASAHQYYDFLKTKPKLATQEQVKQMQTRLVSAIEQKLKKEKEFRIVARHCPVYLKPNTKSLKLISLMKGVEVVVLETRHKWVYISFPNTIDNLEETGWILKKYIDKP